MTEAKAKKAKADTKAEARLKKRHCFCILLTILVIVGAVALALYLVYRPRRPRVVATPVDMTIDEFALLPHPVLKVSVGVHVVVSNPSNAPYRYGPAVSPVTYRGEPVGKTAVPAGEIGARDTRHVEPETVVDGVKVAENPHFAADAIEGVLPFVVPVRLVGKALVLGTFEVPVTVETVCFVRMYVFHGESSSHCVSDVRTGGSASSSSSGSGSGGRGGAEKMRSPPPPPRGAGASAGYPEGYAFEHD